MSQYFLPLPPSKIHSSKSVSPTEALSLLSAYIAAADSDPSLQPNAVLTEDGPTGSLSGGIGGTGTSLAIHNLRRIEAALRGERLAPPPKPEREQRGQRGDGTPEANNGGDGDDGTVIPETPKLRGILKKPGRPGKGKGKGGEEEGNGEGGGGGDWRWQDAEEYEREQEEIEGEVGDRMAGVVEGSEAVENLVGVEKHMDKEARRRAKKDRHKKEKRDREKAREGAGA